MLLLADTSAWHRASHPDVEDRWGGHLDRNQVATTELVRLEVLYSAQNALEYDQVDAELRALRQLPGSAEAFRRALEVQRLLALRHALHHRLAITDLIIGAVAELQGATVWHYDADYDRIAEVTGQPVEWIAPRGSL